MKEEYLRTFHNFLHLQPRVCCCFGNGNSSCRGTANYSGPTIQGRCAVVVGGGHACRVVCKHSYSA